MNHLSKPAPLRAFLESLVPHPEALKDPKASHLCVMCGQPAIEFKDALSLKEFTISRMCQGCQDSVFDQD